MQCYYSKYYAVAEVVEVVEFEVQDSRLFSCVIDFVVPVFVDQQTVVQLDVVAVLHVAYVSGHLVALIVGCGTGK